VIEAYKKHIDLTLLRENLRRTPEERNRRGQEAANFISKIPSKGR